MKKRWIWIIGLVVVALGIGVGVWAYRSNRKPTIQYETTKVERGKLSARVTATGTLSALVTVQVGSQVSGRIIELHADYNSQVKKGDLLAKLDPQLFQANVTQASANLMAARGNLARAQAQAANAKIQYERTKTLAERNLVAQADLDAAQATYLSAQAEVQASRGSVEQASASLHQSQISLTYTKITSPVDGVVISRSIDVGQTVAASLQAPTLFTIAEDLRKMQVDTNVSEADVGKLQPNMPATFTVDAYPNVQFKGVVRQIRNAPVTVQNVVTYDAVIDVENQDLRLKPGMTANVTFIYAERDDTIKVPNAALRYRPSPEVAGSAFAEMRASRGGNGGGNGGPGRGPRGADSAGGAPSDRKIVWRLRGTTVEPVRIKTGISDGSVTEVVEGQLQDGDLIVTGASGGDSTPQTGAPAGGGTNRSPSSTGGLRRIL